MSWELREWKAAYLSVWRSDRRLRGTKALTFRLDVPNSVQITVIAVINIGASRSGCLSPCSYFRLVKVNKVPTSLVRVKSRKATSSLLAVMINGRIIQVKVNSTWPHKAVVELITMTNLFELLYTRRALVLLRMIKWKSVKDFELLLPVWSTCAVTLIRGIVHSKRSSYTSPPPPKKKKSPKSKDFF